MAETLNLDYDQERKHEFNQCFRNLIKSGLEINEIKETLKNKFPEFRTLIDWSLA